MTDQPLTDKPGTADEPLVTPPGTTDEQSAGIDYSIPQNVESAPGGFPMRQVYKFFQLAVLNAKEELQFNKDFEGWTFAGMAAYGPRVVVLGTRFMPVVEAVEEEVVEEEADPGMLDDDVEEKEPSNTPPTRQVKVVNPF